MSGYLFSDVKSRNHGDTVPGGEFRDLELAFDLDNIESPSIQIWTRFKLFWKEDSLAKALESLRVVHDLFSEICSEHRNLGV